MEIINTISGIENRVLDVLERKDFFYPKDDRMLALKAIIPGTYLIDARHEDKRGNNIDSKPMTYFVYGGIDIMKAIVWSGTIYGIYSLLQ